MVRVEGKARDVVYHTITSRATLFVTQPAIIRPMPFRTLTFILNAIL